MTDNLLNLLQIFAGGFYFLNKVFLLLVYLVPNKRIKTTNILASIVYPFGLPFWIIIFYLEKDFIALSLELGGLFSMILSIRTSTKGKDNKTVLYEKICLYITFFFLVFGTFSSLYTHSGITSFTQVLEIFIVVGFLVGTYKMARQSSEVYYWFSFMNLSCATLMLIQENPILFGFQICSLICMVTGAYLSRKNKLI